MLKYRVILLFFLLLCPLAWGDTVVLKSGQSFEGKIISRDEKKLQIDFDGMSVTYWMDEVEAIKEAFVDAFVKISDRSQGDARISNPGKRGVENSVRVSGLSVDELILIREIMQGGLKGRESEVGLLLQKYKADLDQFKKVYVDEFHQSSLTSDPRAAGLWSGTRKEYLQLLSLLLVEAEQARMSGNKEVVKDAFWGVCNYLTQFINDHAVIGKGNDPDLLKNRLLRSVLNNFFILTQAMFLDKGFLDKGFVEEGVVALRSLKFPFFEFERRDFEIRGLIYAFAIEIEDDFYLKKSLREVMVALYAPAVVVPWESASVDNNFWRKVYAELPARMNDDFPMRNDGEENRLYALFLERLDEKIVAAEVALKAGGVGDGQDKIWKTVTDVYLVSEFKKIRKAAIVTQIVRTQLDLVRLGFLTKLFELDNNRSLTSLSELVPRYIEKVPVDDFSSGDLITYSSSDQGGRICSVGPDGKDDQGKEMVNSRDFWQGKEAGDICVSFK